MSTPARSDPDSPTSNANAAPELFRQGLAGWGGAGSFDPRLLGTLLDALAGGVHRFSDELDRLYQREQSHLETIRTLRDQLDRTASIQRNLLPPSLPTVRGLEVSVVYRPAEVVSGDTYDAVRLDESHVAFSIADATGHGLPAALLSAFVQRGLRGSDGRRGPQQLFEPDAVLRQVNRDLCAAELVDCQFVAALYAVFDEASQVIRWARGGIPYPVLARTGEAPRRIASAGPLVGVRDDPEFEVVELALRPGDRLLFHTDGADPMGDVSELASLEPSQIEQRLATVPPHRAPVDDVTVLVLDLL